MWCLWHRGLAGGFERRGYQIGICSDIPLPLMGQSVAAESKQKSFPSWFPNGCPADGKEVNATLFRGCENSPPTAEDFTPHARSMVEHKRRKARDGSCLGYGLSVWVSKDDALHAQALFNWAARWYIYSGVVVPDDGRLAPTGSKQQPSHHSFWVYDGVDIRHKFTPSLPPLKIANNA